MIDKSSSLNNILTQEEIDALLNPEEGEPQHTNAVNLLKNNTHARPLPEFEKEVDSFARHFVGSLRRLTESENIAVRVSSFISGQLGSYLDTLSKPTLLGFIHLPEWNQEGLLSIDTNLAYSLIDMCLGGRRGTSAMQLDGRLYTRIEQDIIKKCFVAMCRDLTRAFESDFFFENLDTNPQTAIIAPPACEMMIVRFEVHLDKRGGSFDFVLPAYLISKMKEENGSFLQEEKREPPYNSLLKENIEKVPLELQAVLDEKTLSFSDIIQWKKGTLLPLSYFENKPVLIKCQETALFKGEIQANGKNLSIRLTQSLMEDE